MPDDYTKDKLADLEKAIEKGNDKLDDVKETLIKQAASFSAHEINDRKDIGDISQSLGRINEHLDTYNKQLEIHITNSEANSQQLKILQDTVVPIVTAHQEAMVVKKWSTARIARITKILTAISIFAGIVFTILKISDIL